MAFELSKFRILYTEFATSTDDIVSTMVGLAECYVPTVCAGGCGDQMLMMMVAHLLKLRGAEVVGQGARLISSATIANVSVSLTAPANGSDRSAWLMLSSYGTQYAVLEAKCLASAKAGMFFGGLPESRAFRKTRGIF